MDAVAARRSRVCPTCNTRGVPVLYGMPTGLVRPAVEQGLLAFGGCVVQGDVEFSTWFCPECEESFAGPDTRRALRDVLRPFVEPIRLTD